MPYCIYCLRDIRKVVKRRTEGKLKRDYSFCSCNTRNSGARNVMAEVRTESTILTKWGATDLGEPKKWENNMRGSLSWRWWFLAIRLELSPQIFVKIINGEYLDAYHFLYQLHVALERYLCQVVYMRGHRGLLNHKILEELIWNFRVQEFFRVRKIAPLLMSSNTKNYLLSIKPIDIFVLHMFSVFF